MKRTIKIVTINIAVIALLLIINSSLFSDIGYFTSYEKLETLIDFRNFNDRVNDASTYYRFDRLRWRLTDGTFIVNTKLAEEKSRLVYENKLAMLDSSDLHFDKREVYPQFKPLEEEIHLNNWQVKVYQNNSLVNQYKCWDASPHAGNAGLTGKNYLTFKVEFPATADPIMTEIKPPFPFMIYDFLGKLTHEHFGLINNIDIIKSIKIRSFAIGKIDRLRISLRLKDHRNNIIEYPLGYLFDWEKDASSAALLNYPWGYSNVNQYLYRYKNASTGVFLLVNRWENEKFLARYYRDMEREPLYPRQIPYIQFHSIVIEKPREKISNDFILFIESIEIGYDEFDKSKTVLDVMDDNVFKIVSEKQKEERRNLEKALSKQIYTYLQAFRDKGYSYSLFYDLVKNRVPGVRQLDFYNPFTLP